MSGIAIFLLLLGTGLSAAIVALLIRDRQRTRVERALRVSEERSRALLDRTPVMIWSARPDTTLDYLNQTCVQFAGMPLEKLKDEGWLDSVHPDDRERCMAIYGPAFEARVPFLMEYRVRRADGVDRWLLAKGAPHFDSDGAFTGFVGCDIDITERRLAEDAIRASQSELEASHQEIQQLAGRLLTAHEDERRRLARELHDDLTQRLARLAIDAGRLENATGAPDGLRAMREDLIRLSEDVHALSYRLHPSVLDDLGLVEALRAECDRVTRQGALLVAVEAEAVTDSLPQDASLCLFRVAQEALRNASRHSRASNVMVRLTPGRTGLSLAITDDGVGFDPQRPRERASLGLASMRERVRLLQGEFDITSSPGRGTTVIAWLPAQ